VPICIAFSSHANGTHGRARAYYKSSHKTTSQSQRRRKKKKKKKGRTSHWPPLSVQPEQLQLAPGQPEHWHLPLGQQCASSGQQHASGCGQQPSPCVVSQHVWCELRIRRNDFFFLIFAEKQKTIFSSDD
jgi:hypothetical protein